MLQNKFKKTLGAFISLSLLCFALSSNVLADVVDDIVLKVDANGDTDAIVKFDSPVQYMRHFPVKASAYLEIYFNILDKSVIDQWVDYESHRSPPSNIVLGFTITTRDITSGPKVVVQFAYPEEYDVRPGKDGRSIFIHIKSGGKPKDNGTSSAAATATALPAVIPKPSVPTTSTPAAPKAAEAQQKAASPAPTKSPATTAAVAPVVVQASPPKSIAPVTVAPASVPTAAPVTAMSLLKPEATSSNASTTINNDGLPAFPAIEVIHKDAALIPVPAGASLEIQIRAANYQAAIEMNKARDAYNAGQFFAAVEAFNNVLKLPPNRYSQDAEVWIAITREKAGDPQKARLEYESFLKLYPNGAMAFWVKQRLTTLNQVLPPPQPKLAKADAPKPIFVSTPFQTTEYGSLSTYYYHGASHTDTISTVGGVQTPTSLTATDQSSILTNISSTLRSYNNEFDNRFVFQDFRSQNLLPGGETTSRLNAAYVDIRNRQDNYDVRLGRQSAIGGGVMGRFDGIYAGYGFTPDYRISIVDGRLSDSTIGAQPVFFGTSLDFGLKSTTGGSVYIIKQTVEGILDRKAIGGNMRYFQPGMTAMSMMDYDIQFNRINFLTLQGTFNTPSTDYNVMLDRRRAPTLSIRTAVNGTVSSISTLLANGFTQSDLVSLADLRTATSNLAIFGFTNHLNGLWQMGTDVAVSNTSSLEQSGTLLPDGSTGVEGFVAASPASGNIWTLSERLNGNNLISSHDMTMFNVSVTKSPTMNGSTFMIFNHDYWPNQWSLDTTLRFYWQTDNTGGKVRVVAPVVRTSFKPKPSLTVDAEAGLELNQNSNPTFQQSSNSKRNYFSLGGRWDF